MTYDLLALAVLAVFAGLGALRGALASGLALATLLLAYVLSVELASPLAPGVATASGAPPFLAAPLAGALIFLAVTAAGTLATALLRSARRRRLQRRRPRSRLDLVGGALFGAGRGLVVVLAVGLLAIWIDAAPGAATGSPPLVARATRAAVQGGAATLARDDSAARFLVEAATNPRDTMNQMQGVLGDPSVMALRDDAGFWDAVEQGDVDGAMDRPSFSALASDDALRSRLAELGLVDQRAAEDADAFDEEAAKALRELGPRLHALRSDAELQKLLQDPEIVTLAQQGDTLALLARPDFQKLVAHVLEAARAPE